jgi:hypothetical protein
MLDFAIRRNHEVSFMPGSFYRPVKSLPPVPLMGEGVGSTIVLHVVAHMVLGESNCTTVGSEGHRFEYQSIRNELSSHHSLTS